MRRLSVVTPELVPLEFRVAGPAERAMAWLVDEILIAVVMSLLGALAMLLGVITGFVAALPLYAAFIVAGFVLDLGYRIWAEQRWNGQTWGKKVLGIRVVQANGTPLLGWQAVIRNVARMVDQLPFLHLLGALLIALDPQARRVGDRLAGTVVIQDRRHKPPRALRVLAREQNSLREDTSAVRRVRRRVSAREAAILTEFVAATDRIEMSRRVTLSARLASHYRETLGLEAHRSLPDDAILRGIVGVVAADRFARPA